MKKFLFPALLVTLILTACTPNPGQGNIPITRVQLTPTAIAQSVTTPDPILSPTSQFTAHPEPTTTPTTEPNTTPTTEPTATLEPEPTLSEPPVIIIPEPIPTTVSNQAALIAESGNVDFVIDWAAFEGQPPEILADSENWYKYSPPDGSYSVIMRGRGFPVEFVYIFQEADVEIRTDNAHTRAEHSGFFITSFQFAQLSSGEMTAMKFLEEKKFDFIPLHGETVTIIEQRDIQLNGFPGRDYVIDLIPADPDQPTVIGRLRMYVVGDMVYQLRAAGLDEGEIFGEYGTRFLESFSIHSP